MKFIAGMLTGLMLLAAVAPAEAQRSGGFHGGGAHGGGFHGGHFHGHGGFHGGHFHHGFYGAPFWGYGYGYGLGLGYGYPWFAYDYSDYPSGYAYRYNDLHPYPNVPAQPDATCGTWIWHPETYSYGWLACGAASEITVPMGAPPASPP